MTAAAMDLKKIIQEMVVPELQDIKLKVTTMEVEIRRLDEKVENQSRRLDERIDGVERQIVSLDRQIQTFKDDFRITFALQERIAALEARMSH